MIEVVLDVFKVQKIVIEDCKARKENEKRAHQKPDKVSFLEIFVFHAGCARQSQNIEEHSHQNSLEISQNLQFVFFSLQILFCEDNFFVLEGLFQLRLLPLPTLSTKIAQRLPFRFLSNDCY